MKSELLKNLANAISAGIPVDFEGTEIPTVTIESYIKSGLITGLSITLESYQFVTYFDGISDASESHFNTYSDLLLRWYGLPSDTDFATYRAKVLDYRRKLRKWNSDQSVKNTEITK